ncbi:golgin-84 [Neodiprion virginianus]|uniref:golgin-84 n=1 Tax=Neodiprion virginianus TaxID=2961670 RepID=UPI001EE72614|nr:golgin-84 [Neodiprion virginianus]
MAWLSGLAGKAENLLNKIDQNTAAVLSKEKQESESHSLLTEVTWVPPHSGSPNKPALSSSPTSPLHSTVPQVRSTPNLRTLTPLKSKVSRDEELITFLNTPTTTPTKSIITDHVTAPATPLSICVEPPTDNTDSISEMSIRSGQISPVLSHASVDVPENDLVNTENNHLDLETQNIILRNEIEALNHELNLITHRAHSSESECNEIRHRLGILQREFEHKFNSQKLENETLVKSSKDSDLRKDLKSAQRNLEEKDEQLDKQQTDHQKEIHFLKEKLICSENKRAEIAKQLTESQSVLERNRLELSSTRSELEQHRARALKTLQEKEKLIAELRGNATTGLDDVTLMELDQIRQEREALREENQQLCDQLRIAREELVNADTKLEQSRQDTAMAAVQIQETLALERNRRLAIEEDSRHHAEELRSLQEEVSRQRSALASKLQKQETEISRLRSQLSAALTPSSEVESRLSTLTQTLVLKQQALESLTTERNALRLQLEKIEHQHRDVIGNLRKNIPYDHINDTDDAKAQVPSFLLETPFDTGVARRVKRAYSSLDAVSVRTGVFLRRYPLARILVLVYMVLLHFWVLVVLFSHSPEAH